VASWFIDMGSALWPCPRRISITTTKAKKMIKWGCHYLRRKRDIPMIAMITEMNMVMIRHADVFTIAGLDRGWITMKEDRS